MLKNLKFPLIYILETLAWVPLIASFCATMAFVAAKPISALDLNGKSLPGNWEAAVANHGKYLQGFLISNHPFAFSIAIAALAASAFMLYQVEMAGLAQRKAAGTAGEMAHKIAHWCSFIAVAALFYFLAMHVMVGVSAA